MKLIFDIEADNLLDKVTKIHCIVTKDLTTGKVEKYFGETIAIGVSVLESADVLYAHNGIGYDYPLLKKLYNWQPKGELHDTYILSQLLYPNEMQSHGVAAWGKALGRAKPKHEDWSTFSEEMLHRCTEDVEILFLVVNKMIKRMENHNWSKAIELEYETYRTYCRHNTFAYIDVPRLKTLIKRLEQCMAICDKLILKQAPLIVEYEDGKIVKPFVKSGALSINAKKFLFEADIAESCVKGEFCKVEFKEMNINSTQQLIKFLLDKGWKPDTFNYKTDDRGKFVRDNNGELIVTSPSLQDSAFIGVPAQLKKLLVKRGTFKHRYGVLVGWLNKQVDGKLETFAYTSGTNTARWKHRGLVNVPRVGTYFGKEMRGLFIAPKDMVIVGCDSAQLEARIEGHFCYAYDQGEYAKFLLEADIHQASADAWGISRQDAKSPNYALAYQCSWKKVQELLDCDEHKAKEIHKIYWEMRPAASKLIKDLEKSVEARVGVETLPGGRVKRPELTDARSWIKGIDGRKLFVRSWHSLKNTLIQNAGMLCMKHSYNWLSKQLKEQKIKARIWLCYHDEIQVYCLPKDAEKVRALALQSIEEGGKHFKLNIPLKGDAKISTSWAGSH